MMYFISEDMGTRKGCTLSDVDQSFTWINGYEWMKLKFSAFPEKSVNVIILCQDEILKIGIEAPYTHPHKQDTLFTNCVAVSRRISDEVIERYNISQYIIDPKRRNFKMIVRIVATVIRFIKILQQRIKRC